MQTKLEILNMTEENKLDLIDIYDKIPGVAYQFKLSKNNKLSFPFITKNVIELFGITDREVIDNAEVLLSQIHPDDIDAFKKAVLKSAENLQDYSHEHRHILNSGKIIWLKAKSTPIRMDDGSILWTGIAVDITKQKEAEMDLETRTKAIFEASPVSMMILDRETKIVAANDVLKKVFNVTDDDVIRSQPGDGLNCIISYENAGGCGTHDVCKSCLMRQTVIQVLSTEQPIKDKEINSTFIINEKEVNIWIEMNAVPLTLNNKPHVIISLNDITRRKKAEDLLRESERKFRFLFENAPLSYQSLDTDGCFLNVNLKFLETLGYGYTEIVNNSFEKILADNDSVEKFRTNFPLFKERGHIQDVQFNLKKKNGEIIIVSFDGRCIYNEDGIFKHTLCIFNDISEKVGFENKLRESENKYRTVAEHTHDWEYWMDENHNYIYMSPSVVNHTGYSIEDFNNKNISLEKLATSEFKDIVSQHMNSVLRDLDEICSLTFQIKTKDGTLKWMNHVCRAVYDDDGNFLGRRGSNRDITNMKLAQDNLIENEKNFRIKLENEVAERTSELNEQNSFLRTLLDTIPHPVFVKDTKGNYTSVNEAFLKFYEKERYEVIGNSVFILGPNDAVTKANEIDKKLLNQPGSIAYESNHKLKSGETRNILIYKASFGLDENKPQGVAGIVLDITDQKDLEHRTQNALNQEKELNEMKTNFISMVSHEFRTPLTSILASADLLELYGRTWTEEKYNRSISILQESVQDMVELLNDVLVLSRTDRGKIKYEPSKTDIPKIITQIVDKFNRETNHSHFFESEIDENLPDLNVDEKLVTGILNHLIGNAIKFSDPKTYITVKVIIQNNTLSFKISDEGNGIGDEDLKNIFDPFYKVETVSGNPGSGLGLAIVKKFVDLHHGKISVESEIGKGTSFFVHLPIAL